MKVGVGKMFGPPPLFPLPPGEGRFWRRIKISLVQAIFLGFVQGLTEFLPISSSGHLFFFNPYWNITKIDTVSGIGTILIGTVVAFGVGVLTLSFLMKIVKVLKIFNFSYYCCGMGILMIIL